MRTDTHKALCKLLEGDYRNESSIQLVKRVEGLVSAVRKERDSANSQLGVAVALLKNNNLFHTDLLTSLHRILVPQVPQLSEIRYVLHGDIQPCSVLYSDDTTTLLRLDEGDMMLETDTIEWSDSVTYRCQELLRSTGDGLPSVMRKYSERMAQLVRDERILLNDNGDDEVVEQPAAVVPAPPPFGHENPDHNNPYTHTNDLFTEEAMRKHGWTSETLVSCGHDHYAPVQHPADTVEWTSSNSPTTLR